MSEVYIVIAPKVFFAIFLEGGETYPCPAPSSTPGWSRLIWHNFVKVADN